MSFNPKYVVIIGIAILLMVAFGRNPIEESRQKREAAEAARGGDPLVNAIEDYHAEREGGGMGRGFLGSMGGGAAGSARESGQYPTHQERYPAYEGGYQDYPAAPPGGWRMDDPSAYPPHMTNPYGEPGRAGGSPAVGRDGGYYPPPAVPTLPSSPGLGPQSQYEHRLPDGRLVVASGPRLYTFNQDGKRVPLPDGVYAMLGGRINVFVRDGKKVLLNN